MLQFFRKTELILLMGVVCHGTANDYEAITNVDDYLERELLFNCKLKTFHTVPGGVVFLFESPFRLILMSVRLSETT